jgi:hypothetical protein
MYVNVDGSWLPQATTTLSRTLNSGNDGFFIGRHYWGGHHLAGVIDEVAIYDRALSWEEVQSHFAVATVPEPASWLLLLAGAAGLACLRRRRT